MFVEAMKLNATHGNVLSKYDRARCLVISKELGIDEERDEQKKAVKDRLTRKQYEYNKKAGGHAQLYYINQVIMLLESGSCDANNENVMAGLKKLRDLLNGLGL